MPSTSGDKNAVNMDRRCSNASDTSVEDGAVRKLSQDGTELIATRVSKVTPPKPAANPLQFIKVGPCDLYKTAQEQIKRVEEVKRIKETVKEEAEDWQSNLDNWKCSRRKRQEHIIERVVEVKKLELEEHDRNRRRSKTFSEMMEERNSRGRKTSLMVFKDEEANDLSDLGIGTSSGDDNQSLSDRDERPSNDDTHSLSDRDEQPSNGNHNSVLDSSKDYPEEYTYDRAIQTYVNFTETRVKGRSNINEDSKPTDAVTNGHKETNRKSPPQIAAKPSRESGIKIEEKLALLEERRRSSTDLSSSDKVKLAKVDVLKRRERFEQGDKEIKSPNKVLVNNSQSIKQRLSSLEKQGEVNGVKNVNRLSGEITGSIKDRLTSLERQKSTEKLNGKEDLLRKRLSNGDLSPTQSVKERLSSLKRQGSQDEYKDNTSNGKVPGEVSIKERLSHLDSAINKDVKKVTPDRDPTFSSKLANFQNEEMAFEASLSGGKALTGSERSSSPDEDEIYATKRQQFHRSLDSLDVEGDLGNETFERVQSLEDLDCLGRRNYPPSASSTEMLVFSSQSGDTDREDSGIHTADVSSSVSQADEPVEDGDIVTTISNIHLETNGDNFLEIETVGHRRQTSELSEQLSPLPPIQEIESFETTTVFLHVDDSPEKIQSDDVSLSTSPSVIIGGGNIQETQMTTKQTIKEVPFHKIPSPFILVDIDIDGSSNIYHEPNVKETSLSPLTLKPECTVNRVKNSSPDTSLIPNLESIPIAETVDTSTRVVDETGFPTVHIPSNMASPFIDASITVGSDRYPVVNDNNTSKLVTSRKQSDPASCVIVSSKDCLPHLDSVAPQIENNNHVPTITVRPDSTAVQDSDGHSVSSPISGVFPIKDCDIVACSSGNSEIVPEKEKVSPSTLQVTPVPLPRTISSSRDVTVNSSVISSISKAETLSNSTSVTPRNEKPVTVSGVLKLELSLETLVKETSSLDTLVDPVVLHSDIFPVGGENVCDRPLPVVVSICRKAAPQDVKSRTGTQVLPSKVPSRSNATRVKPAVATRTSIDKVLDAPMSMAEKRRTIMEICEKVDVLAAGEAKSPPTTPFITVHSDIKGNSTKEPLEAVIASRQPVPDTMLLAARETVSLPNKEEITVADSPAVDQVKTVDISQEVGPEQVTRKSEERSTEVPQKVDIAASQEEKVMESSALLPNSAYSGLFNANNGEEIYLPMSTSEILPLNLNVNDVGLLNGGLAFPLGPPSSAEPPKEKPPPPPTESDDEVPKPKPSLRRVDSTKRIKKELRRKRSDFLGIEGNADDDSYLEPVLSVAPPDMTAFLIEEQRQEKQLYRQSICSESDSNPGESRDSGVELDRPQVLTPDQSAQHSRQESEIYGNASITSEEDEITKKEREIIEILEKEEQWRYANNPSEEDLGEKLAEKLRQLEQEKLRLEWERAEEENRRMVEETLRREEKMRLRAKEQELRQQETTVLAPTRNGDDGDGNNLVEAIRAERERLQQEQEELISQRENLIMRETQQLHRNAQQWDLLPSSAMSLQDISPQNAGYQSAGLPPAVPPAPLNYRLSLPDLQEQATCEQQANRPKSHRPPPPIPPAKPLRSISQEQQERENSIKNSRTPSADLSYQPEGVQLRHPPAPAPAPAPGQAQQMTRQTLQALSAAPRSRIVSTDTWIQAKKKPENQRNSGQGNNYNYQHWLIQEAEHRRITEQHQRNAAPTSPRKSTPVSPAHPHPPSPQWTQPQQQREKPLPDAIIQTLTQRVQNRAGFNENKTSPRRDPQMQKPQKSLQISPPTNIPINNMKNSPTPIGNGHTPHNSPMMNNGPINHNGPIINNGPAMHNGPIINNGPAMHNGNVMNNGPNMNNNPMNHSPINSPSTNGDSQEKMLSVSGKKKCSHCGEELGRGAAMIIESLRLFYHIDCFKCCVCHVQLGDGLMGTDVRVRNNKLHCHNCYSSDDGVKFSCV